MEGRTENEEVSVGIGDCVAARPRSPDAVSLESRSQR